MESATQKKQPEAQQFHRLREGALIELQAKAESKGDSPRAFKMLAYTGEVVQRWFGRAIFDLSGIKFSSDATPILKNHNHEHIVGMSSKIALTPAGLMIEGFVSQKTECAREVTELSDEGFKWQASMGLEILSVERVETDVSVNVNGREVTGPVYVIRQSKLRESSFVPVGADGDTAGEVLSFVDERSEGMSKENAGPKPEEKTNQQDVLAVERKRVTELKAAYPKDPAFALLAIEKNWSVLEAKAEYADVLQKQNDELRSDLAKAAKSAPQGEEPIENLGGNNGGGHKVEGTEDFMTLARKRSKEGKISLSAAMSELAAERPDLYEANVEMRMAGPKVKVEPLKKK